MPMRNDLRIQRRALIVYMGGVHLYRDHVSRGIHVLCPHTYQAVLLFGDGQEIFVPRGDRHYFTIRGTDEKMIVMRRMPRWLTQEPELIKPGTEYHQRKQCVKKVFDIFHQPEVFGLGR